jgi:vacuolar-type H+-ATPase subunit E/Vma4
MNVRAAHRRPRRSLAAVGLLAAAVVSGCVSQGYVRGLGRQAATGALDAVEAGMPRIEEPLRQALHRALVDDDTLRRAARDMTETAIGGLEAGLASPEIRIQIDDLVSQAAGSLTRNASESVRRLMETSEPELRETLRRLIVSAELEWREALRRTAVDNVDSVAARLRERIEREVTPATERLARRTGEELLAALVIGLEGPLRDRLQVAGREMSKSLIQGMALGLNEPTNQDSFGGLTQLMSLQAVRGARQGISEGLPSDRQMALVASIVVLGALLLLSAVGLSLYWWRYQQSAKSLTIIAENINQAEADELKAAIQRSAQANYVGPWLSSFLKRRGL